jgi:O-antigen/teichoic acid export membrane protein
MSMNARRVLGAGGLYTIATVAPVLVLLAVTPIVTSMLGSAQYGQVAVAISVYQLGSVVLAFGLPTMVTRDALLTDRGFPGASAHVVVGSMLALVIGVIGALLAPVWSPVFFPGVPPEVVSLAVIAGMGLAVVTLAQALMRAAERVVTFVSIAALAALVPPVLGLLGVLLVQSSPLTYVTGLALGYMIAGSIAFTIAWRHARPVGTFAHARQALAIGLPTVPHGLAAPALLTLALAITVRTVGIETAGQLQVAVMLGSAVVTVLNAVNNMWTPMVFQSPESDRPKFLRSSTFVVSLVAAALISGYVIVAPYVVPFVGGPVITSSIPARASCLIAMAGVFHVMYLANIHLTFISKRTLPLAVLTPASLLLALGMAFALVSWTAIDGLLAMALIWPAFYACQALFSYVLAVLGPLPPVDIRRSLPILVLGALVAVQGAALQRQPVSSVAAVAAATVLLWLWVRVIRRRDQKKLS